MKKFIKYLLIGIILLVPTVKVNAASGLIDIYSSSKSVIVGNSITVTIYCKSSSAIGTCEYTLNYDSSKLKLTSGELSACDVVSNNSTYSMKKSFTFKVVGSGTSSVSVKAYAMRDFASGAEMATSVSPVTIKGMTQSELEATYSTNNNLSSLSIDGYSISPTFNKSVTEYKTTVKSNVEQIKINASVEDNKSSLTGTGTVKVSEGDNKFNIVVTSQKGTKKTYTLIVTVTDDNPINVTIDDKTYTVVKRKSSLTAPNTFVEKVIKINDIEIPAFYSEITTYTLVGLKDESGNIELYSYNEENNSYMLYQELSFNNVKLNIIDTNEQPNKTDKTLIKINDKSITAYSITPNYYLIYAKNIETGDNNWYMYEQTENTVQIYNKDIIDSYEEKLDTAKKMMYYLAGGIGFLTLLLIIVAASKSKKKKDKFKKKKDFDFGETKQESKNNKEDKIKEEMEKKIKEREREKEKEKKSKKDKELALQWTKEVKKVDEKFVLETQNKTKDIKEVERKIKEEQKKADLEQKNPDN